jgi:lysozyme family protein
MLSFHQQKEIINRVIAREGGYVNHPNDPGGETNYGISKRSYPNLNIKTLTKEQAEDIYLRDYLRRYGIDRFDSVLSAEWVMDWVVHSGPYAIRTLQKELGLKVDGVIGPQTINAVNALEDPKDILRWRARFMARITRYPFMVGWLNRLFELGL